MLDEMQYLREDDGLFRLLRHYQDYTAEERDSWLDRCMTLEGVESKRLVELHGLLIAFGWVEQNSGQDSVAFESACPATYRTTAAGRRALKLRGTNDDTDQPAIAA